MVSYARILVVEDCLLFREWIHSMLKTRADLVVLAKASDGVEAVQKSKELKPDLILLDLGLPKLNGIEAARQIRKVAPKSKIIFLSLETSSDIVLEAIRSGAIGYVTKAKAGTDLLKSVDAALQGKQFISAGLTANVYTEALLPAD
jgi:DNA-binding NarL/FixJ family response regulator